MSKPSKVELMPNEVALVTTGGMTDLLMVIPDEVGQEPGINSEAPLAVEFLAACAAKWRHDPAFVRAIVLDFWSMENKKRMH